MTTSVKHVFVTSKTDGTDPTDVKPSDWNAAHAITTDITTGIVLGRQAGSAGPIQELAAPFATSGGLAVVPAASARYEAVGNWSWPSVATVVVPISAMIFNNNGGVFSASAGPAGGHKWTPGAGFWHFEAGTNVSNNSAASVELAMYLDKNNVVAAAWAAPSYGSFNETLTPLISCNVQMTATDYIQLRFAISGDQPGGFNFVGTLYSFLSGFRIG
jgi:hypothetical protein